MRGGVKAMKCNKSQICFPKSLFSCFLVGNRVGLGTNCRTQAGVGGIYHILKNT